MLLKWQPPSLAWPGLAVVKGEVVKSCWLGRYLCEILLFFCCFFNSRSSSCNNFNSGGGEIGVSVCFVVVVVVFI